jgi:hypothetical protein
LGVAISLVLRGSIALVVHRDQLARRSLQTAVRAAKRAAPAPRAGGHREGAAGVVLVLLGW